MQGRIITCGRCRKPIGLYDSTNPATVTEAWCFQCASASDKNDVLCSQTESQKETSFEIGDCVLAKYGDKWHDGIIRSVNTSDGRLLVEWAKTWQFQQYNPAEDQICRKPCHLRPYEALQFTEVPQRLEKEVALLEEVMEAEDDWLAWVGLQASKRRLSYLQVLNLHFDFILFHGSPLYHPMCLMQHSVA